MIATYSYQKELQEERLQLKSSEQQFMNVITKGTNCSPFESKLVLKEAKQVFGIGEYRESNSLQAGQIIWTAISQEEPAGKKIEDAQMKRIQLTFIDRKEDIETQKTFSTTSMRQQQICRMTVEALDQGALLTQEDLCLILGANVRTIRRDIQTLKKRGITIPTRGQQKDIGPGVTHRGQAVNQFLQGKQALDISRDLHHSLHSIERYIDTFCRTVYCQKEFQNTLKTALVVGISVSGVNGYLEIYKDFKSKSKSAEILADVEEKGEDYWTNCDFKKKLGLTERRSL